MYVNVRVAEEQPRKKRAHRLEVTKSITSARYSAQGSFVLDGMKKLTKEYEKSYIPDWRNYRTEM